MELDNRVQLTMKEDLVGLSRSPQDLGDSKAPFFYGWYIILIVHLGRTGGNQQSFLADFIMLPTRSKTGS